MYAPFCTDTKGDVLTMRRDETVIAVGMAEAARRLGLSPRTVATLVSRRQLCSRKVGRRRIIPVTALEAFVRHDPLDSTRSKNFLEEETGSKE
jgi:excisionase family DNA binding protein